MDFDKYSLAAGRTIPNATTQIKGPEVAAIILATTLIEQLGEQIEVIKKYVYHGHKLTPDVTTMINHGMFANSDVRNMTIDPVPALRLNMALGLVGEACEAATNIAAMAMGNDEVTPHDVDNELGDTLWYANGAAVLHRLALKDIATNNIAKLIKRYPDGFSEEASQDRIES